MLKRVYKASDEFMAITIQEMLRSRGIEAMIRRFETSWLDGLPKIWQGGWGEVLVMEENLKEAEEYVEEFLKESAEGSTPE